MKVKKNITIYVDWREQTIYTESELDEAKNDRIEDIYSDEIAFKDWLECNFCASEIFGTDYDEVRSDWHKCCEENVAEDFENLEEVSLEVEVDVSKRTVCSKK